MFTRQRRSGTPTFLDTSSLSAATTRRSLHTTPKTVPSTAKKSLRAEQVLEETNEYVLKARNAPVPVQVQEVLRGNLDGTSMKIHDGGWAWVVSGCKAYLWRHSLKQTTSPCFQFTLPATAGVWSSDLVAVHSAMNTQVDDIYGVGAVSPEGVLRYWRGWTVDKPHSEITVPVGGDCVHSMTNLESGNGFVLITHTGQIFIVKAPRATGPLTVVQLQPPNGILSGFGRRVSSLFFRGQQSGQRETVRLLSRFLCSQTYDVVFALTRTHLTRWRLDGLDEQDNVMQYDCDMEQFLQEAVLQDSRFSVSGLDRVQVWTVDCQMTSEGVAILFAVTCAGPVINYAIAILPPNTEELPRVCSRLILLSIQQPYKPSGGVKLLNVRLQGYQYWPQLAVYDNQHIYPIHLKHSPNPLLHTIVFPPPNTILGSGAYYKELLFFTLNHGVISLNVYSSPDQDSPTRHSKRFSPSVLSTPLPSSQAVRSRSRTAPIPPPAPASDHSDKIEQLKNAFMTYINNNEPEATALCSRSFPSESFALRINTPGDLAAVTLSTMILNDLPAADPRWNEATRHDPGDGIGSNSTSLIVVYQLEDKLEAHKRYIHFLTDVGLLDKLSSVTVRESRMLTRHVLCEHGEKILAAISLKRSHNQMVEEAVRAVLERRPPLPFLRAGLTAQDIYYSQVSGIEDVLPSLLAHQTDHLGDIDSPVERLGIVINVGTTIENMLHEAIQYRLTNASLYSSCGAHDGMDELEYLPWSASEVQSGGRRLLTEQLQIMVDVWDECRREGVTDNDEQVFWKTYNSLLELLFGGFVDQINSIRSDPVSERELEVTTMYQDTQRRFITPLMEYGQFKMAAQVAEQYEHFPTLVSLCEQQQDLEQIRSYFARFSSKGFADYLFKHHLDEGKLQQLLSFSELFPEELEEFLSSHQHLLWLHQLAIHSYSKASNTMRCLADDEQQYLARKKTLLSLSKLSLLASGKPQAEVQPSLNNINTELEILNYQENIPSTALEDNGFDPEQMPPLDVEQIVQLYLRMRGNRDDCARWFMCALELLDVALTEAVAEQFYSLRVYIWTQAVLMDDWSRLTTDEPLEQLQTTFFFKVVQEAYNADMDVLELLPRYNDLLGSPDLVSAGFSNSNKFQYLMQAGYEQVERVRDVNMAY